MRYLRHLSLLPIALLFVSCSSNFTFVSSGPAKLLNIVQPPAAGLVVAGLEDKPVLIMQKEKGKAIIQLMDDSLNALQSYEIALAPESTMQKVWHVGNGNILAVFLVDDDNMTQFTAITIDSKTGTKVGDAVLNRYSSQDIAHVDASSSKSVSFTGHATEQRYSASTVLSPNKKAFAFGWWEYRGPTEIRLNIDVYTPTLSKIRSINKTYPTTSNLTNVLNFFVNDDGGVVVIRSAFEDEKKERQLLVEHFGASEGTTTLLLPKEMAEEDVHANSVAASFAKDGEIAITVGMVSGGDENEATVMKGLLTWRVNYILQKVLSEDQLELTHDKAKEIADDKNLEFFVPHTMLRKADGSFVVLAEALKALKRTETSTMQLAASKSSHVRESYEVYSGDVILLAYSAEGKFLGGTKVVDKFSQELWTYVKSWEKNPERLWHNSFWNYTSASALRGDVCTILYNDNMTIKAVNVNLATMSIDPNQQYSLVEMPKLSRMFYREVAWQEDSNIILAGMAGLKAKGTIMQIALP